MRFHTNSDPSSALKTARNQDNAIKFLELLFSDQGVAAQTATGPAPISPPLLSADEANSLPQELRSVVTVQ